MFAPAPAPAPASDALDKLITEVGNSVTTLNTAYTKKQQTLTQTIIDLRTRIGNLNKQNVVNLNDTAKSDLQKKLADAQKQLTTAQSQLGILNARMQTMIVTAQKGAGRRSKTRDHTRVQARVRHARKHGGRPASNRAKYLKSLTKLSRTLNAPTSIFRSYSSRSGKSPGRNRRPHSSSSGKIRPKHLGSRSRSQSRSRGR